MWKWIGGILAIVISGVALFWFAGLGDLLYPSPPEVQQRSHTTILEFNIQPTYISDDWQSYAVATFAVVNDSDKAAAQCQVEWFSRGNLYGGRASSSFELMPSEKRTIEMRSDDYAEGGQGTYQTTAWVNCSDSTSEAVHRDIHVKKEGHNWDIW